MAGRTIVTESWRNLSFNSHRLNSRQLSVGLKAGAKRERELPRVDESSNSQPRLALNSYALSATLSAAATKETGKTPRKSWLHDEVFRMNLSNKHAAAFHLREKFIALDSRLAVRQHRAITRSDDAVSCHAMNSRQLSFSFGRADDSHRELKKTLGQLSFFNSRQL